MNNFVCQILIIALIALFDAKVLAQNGGGVILNGKLNLKFFAGPGKLVQSMSSSNSFCVKISRDGKWSMEVRPIYGRGDIMYGKEDELYLTFDGTDSYSCRYTEAIEGITNGRPGIVNTARIQDNDQSAYISTGNYPFGFGDAQERMPILWLSFFSGITMQESKTNLPLPWIDARWSLMAYGFRWDCQMTDKFPFAPSKITFIRDNTLDFPNIEQEYNRPELNNANSDEWFKRWNGQMEERKRWINGMVIGVLDSSNFTNHNGVNIPLNSSLAVYVPKSTTPDKTRRLYSIEVDSVADLNDENVFRPPLMGKRILVDDSRFRSTSKTHKVDEVYYKLKTNDVWKSKDDPELKAYFDSYLISNSTKIIEPGHQGRIRKIAVSTFLVGSILSAVAILWFGLKRRSQ